jgi:methylmalonyl-CoA mutase
MPPMASDPTTSPGNPVTVEVPLSKGLEHTQDEWEKATAAVLRKSRRLSDDADDGQVWDELATTCAERRARRRRTAGAGAVHARGHRHP